MHLVSQRYDGASVMSGCCNGVQTQIKKKALQALYVHCNAHSLNFCLVDSVKAVPKSAIFFALLEVLYCLLSSSKIHSSIIKSLSLKNSNYDCRSCQTQDGLLGIVL